ncbi:hypothetical protein [Companilactobacillus jidongensis]|uniref:hypothetical protein n=1 Tax=Companilactobacillus jidongensis TaxID=2486006 RepID=UPI000F7B570D|nr:hypothetical protein [Companilactobacillus jidongensis]
MIKDNTQVVKASTQYSNTHVKPKSEPTEDVRKFLGMWLNRGYTVQPPDTTFTVVGHTVKLKTHSGRSTLGASLTPFASPKYQWYKSTDEGETWVEVPKNEDGNKSNLNVTSNQSGAIYYQQNVTWYQAGGWGLSIAEVWSQVAAVYVNDKDKNAEKIRVSVDDDYLYNNPSEIAMNSTVARAEVLPEDYTEDIVWTVDNNQLAYIDKDTGEIQANNRGVSGVVKVTGTIKNADNTIVSDSTFVQIGGGLEDKEVKSGDSTSFEMLGHIGKLDNIDNDYTVKWYRQPVGTHKRELVESNKKDLSYLVNEPRVKNDNDLYWVEISLKLGRDSYEYISNKAKLKVLPADKPEITLNNSVINETYNNDNTEDVLNDVANGAIVSYRDEIVVGTESGNLKNGTYVLPIYGGTEIDSVKINDKEIDQDRYTVVDYFGGISTVLVIDKINRIAGEKFEIKVRTRIDGIFTNEQMISQPFIYSGEEDNAFRFEGTKKTLNYVTNVLQKDVRDISYGSINTYAKDEIISRTDDTNQPNNVVSVDDQRRVKEPIKVFVNQEKEFVNEQGDVLPGCLRLYDNGKFVELVDQRVKVTETKKDEPLGSIGWNKNNGLLLHIHDAAVAPGQYGTTLNWTFENSI